MNFSDFFSHIQEAPWYRQFLNPVIDEINDQTKLLDVGTGTGKLLEILSKEKNVSSFGIDTSQSMLEEAKKKLNNTNAQLHKIDANENFPFDNNSFDYVTICNVLFNLERNATDHILKETLKVLKDDGRIIVLTPTGKGNLISLTKGYLSLKNLSIYIWFFATKNRAGSWGKEKYLLEFSINNNLKYEQKLILNKFAQVEILYK